VVLGVGWLCDRIGPVRAMRWWLIAEVLLCLALAAPFGLWVLVPAMLLLLVQGRSGGTIAYAQAAGMDRAQRMAIGFGFIIMAWAVGSAVGALLAGSVADALGDTPAYVITALLLVAVVGPGATMDLRRRRAA
jgi:MFS family permease